MVMRVQTGGVSVQKKPAIFVRTNLNRVIGMQQLYVNLQVTVEGSFRGVGQGLVPNTKGV